MVLWQRTFQVTIRERGADVFIGSLVEVYIMTRQRLFGVFALAAVLCASSGLAAPTPLSAEFTYQGSLLKSNATYTGMADMRFRLYDQASGGAQIGSTIQVTNVVVDHGLFTVPLDFGVASYNGDNRWIEIDVRTPAGSGVYGTLGTRQKVTSTPYALQTRGLFTDALLNVGVGTTTPQSKLNVKGTLRIDDGNFQVWSASNIRMSLANNGGVLATFGPLTSAMLAGTSNDESGFIELYSRNGPLTALLEGDLDNSNNGVETGGLMLRSFGTGGLGGQIRVQNNDGIDTFNLLGGGSGGVGAVTLLNPANGKTTAELNGMYSGIGGAFYINSDTGNHLLRCEPDINGGAGFLLVQPGFVVDGNRNGTGATYVSISGASAGIAFDTSTSGDGSVILPANSVSSGEILDEPGVANIHADALAVPSSTGALVSRSITVPGPGYVIAMAQGDLSISHVTGTSSNYLYGVTQSPTSLPGDQDVQTELPANVPTGLFDFSASAHGLFTVNAAGTYTFYFSAMKLSGANATMYDTQLTLMYFPTNYGTVVSNITAPGAPHVVPDRPASEAMPPMNETEIRDEQSAEIARHQASVNAQLNSMRAQVAQLKAQLDRIVNEQNVAAKMITPAPKAKVTNGNVNVSSLDPKSQAASPR